MTALNSLLRIGYHIVSKIVKAHLIVCAVGYVGRVCRPSLVVVELVDYKSYGKTEKAVELAHPLRVAAGEIIVDGYYVNAFSGKSVEVSGQCCDEGFALARFHLGNTTLVKYDTADYLNREVLHIENS